MAEAAGWVVAILVAAVAVLWGNVSRLRNRALLAVEKYSTGRDAICAIDIQRLTDERDWYQTRYNQLNQPESFWKKPSSQRWLGRLEAIGVISILTGGIVAVYSSASGK